MTTEIDLNSLNPPPSIPEAQTTDWWETVFKPNFSIKECRDILDLSYDSDSSLTLPSDEISSFTNVKKVSNDIDKDPNTYRKVWREQRFAKNDFLKLQSCLNETYAKVLNHRKESSDNSNTKSTQTKECIWNEKEMKIIRSCIKDFKNKNLKLDICVKELTNKNEELSNKLKQLETRLQKKKDLLNDAVKANERFHILTETLSNQLDDSKGHIESIITQNTSLVDKLNQSHIIIDDLKKEVMDKEKDINKYQKKLDGIESRYEKRNELLLFKKEEIHNTEVDSLKVKLDELGKELFKERELRQATEKGFQLLLKHYSGQSLNLQPEHNHVDIKSIKYSNL